MLKKIWLNFATLFLNFKECFVKDNKSQSNDEVIADLHTYLEHLNEKNQLMEERITKCNQKALFHKVQAQKDPTKVGKERELKRAKLIIKDKRRLQDEQDKITKFTYVIRQQIDSLTNSELDSIMVDAMRQYNMTAKQMGLPDRTREIDELGNDLNERFLEASQLQQILGEATNPSTHNQDSDEDLDLELESLGECYKDEDLLKVKTKVILEENEEQYVEHENNIEANISEDDNHRVAVAMS
jgi:hypothetical protein